MTNSFCITNDFYELTSDDLKEINGGDAITGFVALAAAVTVGFALFNAAHEAGKSVGQALYSVTHSGCN